MSLLPIGLTLLAAFGRDFVFPTLIRPRSIGGIVANVTVQETGLDELHVTDNPLEQGASVTDHSFKKPVSIVIRAAWSNSVAEALGNPFYVNEIYSNLQALQATRQPFQVLTGKRLYTNMLMQKLLVDTDEKTEYALMVVCECREIILVSTQTVQLPDATNMSSPEVNAPVQKQGPLSLLPGNNFNATAAAA